MDDLLNLRMTPELPAGSAAIQIQLDFPMKSLALGLFRSNSELSDFARKSVRLVDERSRRRAVKIAAIDDAPFQPQTNLQNYGYDVTAI